MSSQPHSPSHPARVEFHHHDDARLAVHVAAPRHTALRLDLHYPDEQTGRLVGRIIAGRR